jgi:hypothetical protein
MDFGNNRTSGLVVESVGTPTYNKCQTQSLGIIIVLAMDRVVANKAQIHLSVPERACPLVIEQWKLSRLMNSSIVHSHNNTSNFMSSELAKNHSSILLRTLPDDLATVRLQELSSDVVGAFAQ